MGAAGDVFVGAARLDIICRDYVKAPWAQGEEVSRGTSDNAALSDERKCKARDSGKVGKGPAGTRLA
jgi:hypothetical protein